MASGGARARSGPPPDPSALRRDRDGDGWVTLPAEGRKGRTPAWPLSKATAAERTLWTREWKRPQAVMWEAHGQELAVALYVRNFVEASGRGAPGNLRTLVRQHQEELGISESGLARNRWRIGTAAPVKDTARRAPSGRAARERFTVVQGGGGE